jgi:hypothetical protein
MADELQKEPSASCSDLVGGIADLSFFITNFIFVVLDYVGSSVWLFFLNYVDQFLPIYFLNHDEYNCQNIFYIRNIAQRCQFSTLRTLSAKTKNLISNQYRECGCIERLAGKIITAPIYNIHEYQLQKHAQSISMA